MKRLLIGISVLLLFFISCAKQELTSHYERPDWLRGNAWQILEERGEFTQFLDGVERAGFREVLEGKTIATVFAPDDQAFDAYLQSKNLTQIGQLPKAELQKLIGYHLVYYAYGKDMLMNYQPGGSEGYEINNAGLYYKHRTRSNDAITTEVDKTDGKLKKIYHKERFLPVFSQTHFDTKGIEASANYEYFFGADSWAGTQGFNVSNSGVKEYAIPADNGYLYILDKVLEPLNTVYDELANNENYRDFITLYDKFRMFLYDEQASINYAAVGDSLFSIDHNLLPPIASEWTTRSIPDYWDLGSLTYQSYNVFAPSNQALQSLFNEYFSPYYGSLFEVDLLPLSMVMRNHVYQGNMVFPSEIGTNPDIKTSFGTPIEFNPNADVQDKAIASNGVFYGLNKVMVPDLFNSVTGPAFRNPKYKMFMYMLASTGLHQTLSSKDIEFTLFIPSDEVLESTLVGNSYLFWSEGNPLVFGDEGVMVQNDDGVLVPLSIRQQELFVSDHIVYGRVNSLSEKKVYRTRNPFTYVYTGDGEIYSSATYNNPDQQITVADIAGNWYNGRAYEPFGSSLLAESRSIKGTIPGSETPSNPLNAYSEFSKLLARAGLLETGSALSFLFGNRFIVFAPDNATVLNGIAEGSIPTDNVELAAYLKSYFISIPDNSLGDYPFPGFGIEGVWKTTMSTGYNVYRQLEIIDQNTRLELKDIDGTIIPVSTDLPKLFSDGAVYKISGLLKK
ncbi:hypothetical protein FAZ19_04345 [Sphingobacterium alkalisoli]|uniref:FAS1 domain-containing protein n=1 Tax=Sphingobacterium alkalisoli TaxID=1874115 RepID=A0A4U0H9H7_9SPHI|nr:fasciclin domain-containing protein [Sphingobacterium alkalisoli]TJY68491.1 hypothetical protein FAZ19_04345 [Sphingobacterium alkalisoli]GGH06116.1 fasciclin [Sphingobacterium alkalisoli]